MRDSHAAIDAKHNAVSINRWRRNALPVRWFAACACLLIFLDVYVLW
jgi:hypothetical protein